MFAVHAASPANTEVATPTKGPGANFDRQAYVEGLRDAPGLLAKAGVACTVKQAVYEGESSLLDGNGKIVGHARLYEAACAEGLGYMINVRGKEAPIAFDCIAGGQTGKIACMLPLNDHPAGALEPFMKAAGIDCRAVRARRIAEDDGLKVRRYEVSCEGDAGYIVDIPLADGSGPAPKAIPCFEVEADCHFVSHVENVARLAFRVGKRFGDSWRIGDARYVGYVAARGHELYEVSCQAGHDGELIEVDDFGALKGSQDCSKVKLVGAACQLKSGDAVDSRIALAEQTGAEPPPPPGAKRTRHHQPRLEPHSIGSGSRSALPCLGPKSAGQRPRRHRVPSGRVRSSRVLRRHRRKPGRIWLRRGGAEDVAIVPDAPTDERRRSRLWR